MRGLRIGGLVAGGLVIVIALLLLAISLFVNPNDYKGRIAQQVTTSTGRELNLQGDIKLSVFPWIALNLGPLSLGNPPGFGSDPFLSIRHTALRVKLLPLLHKELEIGRIEIDGLDLRLKTDAAGKGNWEDFGQKKDSAAPQAAGSGRSGASLQSLDGVEIRDSRVSYNAMTLTKLNLAVGKVSPQSTVPVKAGFDLNTGAGGSDLTFKAAFAATLDAATRHYGLQGVDLEGDFRGASATLPWKFSAPAVVVDLAAQTLKAPSFAAQAGAAHLSGSLSGERISAAPALSGAFTLTPLDLREFMTQLGITPPKTQDATALSKLGAISDFAYGKNALRLEKLDFQLDDSHLRGVAVITSLDTKAMTFDLNVDHIDLDRYLPPKSKSGAPAAAAARTTEPPAALPTTAVRSLDIDGKFSIGSAKVEGMTVSNLRLGLQAKEGIVHLSPLSATLYGGTCAGDITYDAHGAVPSVKIDEQVAGVDMAGLLKDSMKSERLSGHGHASVKLAGAGLTSDALTKNLSGHVELNLVDGAVNGIDLWYELNRAQALLKQQTAPAGSDDHRTRFDAFKMSADISGGVATTRDLNVASQYLRVTGSGTSNLLTEAIDYHIVATVLKAPPSGSGANLSALTLGGIPVEITGSASDPKVRPDLQGLVRSQLKQKLQDTVQDKLKGLFGH
jgi:AsmA protein